MDLSFHTEEGVMSVRTRAIMIHDGRLLIMRDIEENWYLTGGRVGWGESAATALEREMVEEVGIRAKASRLLWLNQNYYEKRGQVRHDITFYYLIDFSGTDLLSRGETFETMENGIPHIFRWVTFEELQDIPFFPPFIKDEIFKIPYIPALGVSRYADFDTGMDLTFPFEEGRRWFNVRVCAVYVHDGKLLALHDGKAPFWYLPGGRVHMGESVLEALGREVAEELETEMRMVRPLWICQSLYESDAHRGEVTHELCFYFLMEADEELLSRGDEFLVDEEQLDHFKWHPLDSLDDLYLKPDFLKAGARELPSELTLLSLGELS